MTSTQQRAELQRRIWQIDNHVRGTVDGYIGGGDDQLRKSIDAFLAEIEGEGSRGELV
jgi:hypothetical protein